MFSYSVSEADNSILVSKAVELTINEAKLKPAGKLWIVSHTAVHVSLLQRCVHCEVMNYAVICSSGWCETGHQ